MSLAHIPPYGEEIIITPASKAAEKIAVERQAAGLTRNNPGSLLGLVDALYLNVYSAPVQYIDIVYVIGTGTLQCCG